MKSSWVFVVRLFQTPTPRRIPTYATIVTKKGMPLLEIVSRA
jgi:hypothetical protein